MRSIVSFVAVLLAAASLEAQKVAESVEVTVVEVPVTVSDRAGNSIRGLSRENFELSVDGRRVPVEYFEIVDLTGVTSRQSGPMLPPAAWRNFLLLFDMANSDPGATARAKEAARAFVESQLGERDLVAVATYTVEQGANMVTSFTRDREFLLGAIATLGDSKYFKTADPLMLVAEGGALQQPGAGREDSPRGIANAAMEQAREEANRSMAAAHAGEMRNRVRLQLQNLGSVARALDVLHGQKQVILLSEGFDAKLITGKDDLSFRNTQQENDAVLSGEVWKVDSDQRFGSASETRDISDMVELFRRSDVRLHAIDIKGLRGGVDAREGAKKANNDSLFMLTRPTGGAVFQNANDLSSQFDELLRRQEVVYLLGFKASPRGKPGQFHPLRVRLVGAKGEIAHRSGYYETSPRLGGMEAAIGLSEILVTGREIRDVPMTLVATPVPGSGDTARVPVVVELAGPQLLDGVSGTNASAVLFVYAFDEKGQVRDYLQQRVALDLRKSGDAVRASGVRYVGALRLPPGHYSIRSLVRVEETGRTGASSRMLTVPRFESVALLPPAVAGETGKWVTLVSPTRGAEATSLLTLGDTPFIPLPRADVERGGERNVTLMLRGYDLARLAITPTLSRADGSSAAAGVTLAGRTSPDDHGVVKLLFRFAPAADAGDYELRFAVGEPDGQVATVSMPVTIR